MLEAEKGAREKEEDEMWSFWPARLFSSMYVEMCVCVRASLLMTLAAPQLLFIWLKDEQGFQSI